ncbi:50S ribosomal protein L10 [Candidatus Woesearchaeota archaeon]|nr:50S ribosomal protein L10 [Candidatus Woesearchaeota archaeon]
MTEPSAAKKETVAEFVKLIDEFPIIGVVDMENLPAKQLQHMRAKLREQDIVLKMTKRRLIAKAFEQAKKDGLDKLSEHISGMPAMIFTKENPFALFKLLKKSQSKAPIKGGQTAPDDIIVPAGPTSFAPGPIIGELGGVGIKAGVEDGKIAIKEDSKVASAGDEVSQLLAGILSRLGIEPMRIGLNINAVLENGEILTKAVLDIDEEAYMSDLIKAHTDAFSLAMEIGFPTKETITNMLQKAFMDATALALDRGVVNGETIKPLLSKAYATSLALSGLLPDEALSAEAKAAQAAAPAPEAAPAGDAPKEEKKEEKKPEEAAAGLGSLFG